MCHVAEPAERFQVIERALGVSRMSTGVEDGWSPQHGGEPILFSL